MCSRYLVEHAGRVQTGQLEHNIPTCDLGGESHAPNSIQNGCGLPTTRSVAAQSVGEEKPAGQKEEAVAAVVVVVEEEERRIILGSRSGSGPGAGQGN